MPTLFTANDIPTRGVMTHDQSTVVVGNAIAVTIDAAQVNAFFARQSPSADGNTFTNSFWCRSGVYTLSIRGQTNAGNAKIDWYIDNVLVAAGQDWYSAAVTRNVVKTVSVTLTDGYHVLKGIINGRNAANVTAYNMDLETMWVRQAAD